MIVYVKLWKLLRSRGYGKMYLLKVISTPTLAKLSKNANVDVSTITKICELLNCQPGDIMSYVKDI